jgi:hypothetical protein
MSANTFFSTKALVASTLFGASAFAATATSSAASGGYTQVADYSGDSFFSGFDFFTTGRGVSDPTTGYVSYVDAAAAKSGELAGFIYNETANGSSVYIGVDYTTNLTTSASAAGRNALRLNGTATFSNGLLMVADVLHMPMGVCGTWPALWLVGPNWPNDGEIDIIEGVNAQTQNQMTLHTSNECVTNNASSSFLGNLLATNCSAYANGNAGCSIMAPENATLNYGNGETCTHPTAGTGFNEQGGAVYVILWNGSGIDIYMFPHEYVPSDISSGNPNPASWTVQPLAHFGGSGCDFNAVFTDLNIVINTDFCGQWAGQVWEGSQCQKTTGAATCDAYVAANPSAFKDAYWSIASIKVYQTTGGTNTGTGVGKRDVEDFPTINVRDRYQEGQDGGDAPLYPGWSGTKSSTGPHGHRHGEFGGEQPNANGSFTDGASDNSTAAFPPSPLLNGSVHHHEHHRHNGTFGGRNETNGTHHHHNGSTNATTEQPHFTSNISAPGATDTSVAQLQEKKGGLSAGGGAVVSSGAEATVNDASVFAWLVAAVFAFGVAFVL